jgi:hypothetical protein
MRESRTCGSGLPPQKPPWDALPAVAAPWRGRISNRPRAALRPKASHGGAVFNALFPFQPIRYRSLYYASV